MALFKGKNDLNSSASLMFERAKYKNYMKDNKTLAVKDFSLGEYVKYGRIDPAMNIVYNHGLSIKTLDGSAPGDSHFACDFVADAFNNIRAKINDAILKGAIPTNIPYISDFRAYVSYQNPLVVYESYISRMLTNYNEIFLKDYKINSFDDYYKFFIDYATRMGYDYPMTFSGFQTSKHSNIFTSGLAIAITDFPIDRDENKEKFFIDSPAFPFLKDLCLNNGMVMMENAPWIMVADILSPSLLLYTKNYYLSTKNSIFLKHFNYCIDKDIELLINNLLIYYRKYYNKNIYYNDFTLCKEGKVKIEKIFLEPINTNNIQDKYTDSYIYDLYIKIKNIEENNLFSEDRINEIIKKSKFLEKTFDNSEALGYIRKEFREIHKYRHGGLNYLNERATIRRNNDISNT